MSQQPIRRVPIIISDPEKKYDVLPSKALCIPSDKLSKTLFTLDEKTHRNMVIGRKRKTIVEKEQSKTAETKFWLEFIKDCGLDQQLAPLNSNDLYVLAACFSEQIKGNCFTTDAIIWRNMGGKGNPESKNVDEIRQSINKMMSLRIRIDATNAATKLNQIKNDDFKKVVIGTVLPCEYEMVTLKGAPNTLGIKFYALSPVLRYALAKRQMTFIPSELLQVDNTKNTQLFRKLKIVITDSIIKIARTRKNQKSKRMSNFPTIIVLDKVYEACELLECMKTNRKKRKQVKDLIDIYMESLVTKELLFDYHYLDENNNPVSDIKYGIKIWFDYNKPKLDSLIEAIYKIPML